jgi:hypothetical protein
LEIWLSGIGFLEEVLMLFKLLNEPDEGFCLRDAMRVLHHCAGCFVRNIHKESSLVQGIVNKQKPAELLLAGSKAAVVFFSHWEKNLVGIKRREEKEYWEEREILLFNDLIFISDLRKAKPGDFAARCRGTFLPAGRQVI